MFRVHDRTNNNQVFTQKDPREDGFKGKLEEGVGLDYSLDVHRHQDGEARPECVLGLTGPKMYKVFKYRRDRDTVAEQVPGMVATSYSWPDYVKSAWSDEVYSVYVKLTEDQRKFLVFLGTLDDGSKTHLIDESFLQVRQELIRMGLVENDGNLTDEGEAVYAVLTGEDVR